MMGVGTVINYRGLAMKKYLSLLAVMIIIVALLVLSLVMRDSPKSADLILFNGEIYTVNEQQPWAQAVAIKNGDIVAVGSTKDVKKWQGDTIKLQDLNGKMLLPGFIDSHAHPVMGGAYVRSLSLDTFAEPEQWLQQVGNPTGYLLEATKVIRLMVLINCIWRMK